MISAWPQVHVVLLFERRQVVALFVRSLLCVKLLDVVDEVVVGLASDEPVREGGSVPDVPAVCELEHRAFPLVDRPSKAETELATEFHLNSGVSSQRQLSQVFCLNYIHTAQVLQKFWRKSSFENMWQDFLGVHLFINGASLGFCGSYLSILGALAMPP